MFTHTVTVESNSCGRKSQLDVIFQGILIKFNVEIPSITETEISNQDLVEKYYNITKDAKQRSEEVLRTVSPSITNEIDLLDNIFAGKITWGRIFVSFAFSVDFLSKFSNLRDRDEKFKLISGYLNETLNEWVNNNGKWDLPLSSLDAASDSYFGRLSLVSCGFAALMKLSNWFYTNI